MQAVDKTSQFHFPAVKDLVEYFRGRQSFEHVHYFNIATYFLKKDEIFALPPEQRKNFFEAKLKKLPIAAQELYYSKLSKLAEEGVLSQDGFSFQLTSLNPIANELFYLKEVLASGDVEQIKAAREYCDEKSLTEAKALLSQSEKDNLDRLLKALEKQTQIIEKQKAQKPVEGKLTDSQQKAFDSILDFCLNSTECFYKLVGYAGTGKSFLTAKIIKALLAKEKAASICIACPTNKAANNIKSFVEQNNLSTVEVTTIAKLLGLFPEIEIKEGKEVFTSNGESKISDFNYIFVDEYSMLNTENLEQLLNQVSVFQKVIFVGDNAQLPPVKEKQPPVDELDISHSQLTEVLRYDGELIKISEAVRNDVQYNRFLYPFYQVKDDAINCIGRKEWCYKAAELMATEQFKENPLFARVLVWKNRTAEKVNDAIRGIIFGKNCKKFEEGDLVIAKKPVFRRGLIRVKGGGEQEEWMIVMNNSEEAVVVGEATQKLKTIKLFGERYEFNYWSVPVRTDSNLLMNLQIIIDADALQQAKDKAKAYIKAATSGKKELWEEYQVLEKTFDDCPFAYAITIHKSQGSTIDNVFVDVSDMKGCPDLQKLQYTAITRTKEKLWIPLLK